MVTKVSYSYLSNKNFVNLKHSVFFIYGNDEFLRKIALKELVSCLNTDVENIYIDDDFNEKELIYSLCSSVTFIGNEQLSTLKIIQPKKTILKNVIDILIEYRKDSKKIIISCMCDIEKDIRILIEKYIEKCNGLIVSAWKPKSIYLYEIVRKIAKSHNITMSDKCINVLLNMIGNDLINIDAEMQKMSIFFSSKNTNVSNDDEIKEILMNTAVPSINDISKYLNEKQFNKIISLIYYARTYMNDSKALIIWLLEREFRVMHNNERTLHKLSELDIMSKTSTDDSLFWTELIMLLTYTP